MIRKNKKNNLMYDNFDRYKHEILLDTYDHIVKSDNTTVKMMYIKLGSNEIHHMLRYHHKMTLNALYFKDDKIFLDYHTWLYRVYCHRGIDLDFFNYILGYFKEVCEKYIDSKITINIISFYDSVLDQHENLKREANKKKILIDHVAEATTFCDILLSANKQKAYEICKEKCENIDQFLEFYNNVISNAMKNVGYLWESGDISVAKEHISSNTLNEVMAKVLDEFPSNKEKNKHIFLSSAPHEHHGQGINIASKVFEKLGYKVTNLGTNIPTNDIIKAILEFQPDFIILAATLQTSLIDIKFLIDEILEDEKIYTKPFKVGIAGNAFEKVAHPTKIFNASFYMKKLEDIDKYI